MAKQPLLLDTCALIWIAEGEAIAEPAMQALDAAHGAGTTTYVSPISAWEIGLLVARQRLKLLITPQRWFQRILETPHLQLAPMPAELLIESSFLPGTPPRDPADRIVAATARDHGCMLITRDRALLDYAGDGHISALEC